MKSSPNGKIFSTLKRHSKIAIILGIIAIILPIIIVLRGLLIDLLKTGWFWCMNHPFFSGVMISWFVAISSTFIVLFIAYINRGKKEQYKEIFRQSEKWLLGITVVVLFYIALHLASKAFYPIGIPIFGEPYARIVDDPYAKLDFLKYISPQDIFLSSLAFWIIILIFSVAPRILLHEYITLPRPKIVRNRGLWCFSWVKYCRMSTVHLFFIIVCFISGITALIVYFCPFLLTFTSILTAPSQNVELSEHALHLFTITFLISLIISLLLWVKTKLPKGIKGDFRELLLFFCVMPAIIVASLVLAGDELVKFPNVFGHIVVGVLLISGFFTLVTLTTISFKFKKLYVICGCLAFASLTAISGFSALFLFIALSQEVPKVFGNILSFAVAIILIVLLYGFFYEKLQKYRFTEWWRREYKPIAMIISMVIIVTVSPVNPDLKLWEKIPIKLLFIFAVLIIVVFLPWIYGRLKEGGLPRYQRIVLVKAKTDPDSFKKVVNGLEGMVGVYQTMVVRGEYDVCLIVEGASHDDIDKRIFEIRTTDGVASTTTLLDIREFFDR